MKKVQFTPQGTLVAQFAAGLQVTAIQDGDTIYLPAMKMGLVAETSATPAAAAASAPAAKKAAPEKAAAVEDDDADEEEEEEEEEDDAPAPKKKVAAQVYTMKQLKAIDDKDELLAILDNRIDPDSREGKKTAEKYRRLIIEAQEAATNEADAEEDADEEEEKPQPKKSPAGQKPGKTPTPAPANSGKKKPAVADLDDEDEEDEEQEDQVSVNEQIKAILTDVDAGDMTVKKATAALMKLGSKGDAVKLTKVVSEFSDEEDADIAEVTDQIEKMVTGKVAPKEKASSKPGAKSSPASASKGKKAPEPEEDEDDDEESDGEEVEISDLAKGDAVSVYWSNHDDWFSGIVKSVKKGVVIVDYEDETSSELDADIHTKIVRYPETEEDDE